MRGSHGTNPAAGTRHLGARSFARLLEDQTEELARVQHADRMLEDLCAYMRGWVRAQHEELRMAEAFGRAANERACSAEFRAAEPASEAVAA